MKWEPRFCPIIDRSQCYRDSGTYREFRAYREKGAYRAYRENAVYQDLRISQPIGK